MTHIIHVAWRLDFNLSLSSYEGLIASARNLVNVAAECKETAQFLFTSSISAAVGWDAQNGPVPEQVLPSDGVASGMGYGASKYVVERVSHGVSTTQMFITGFLGHGRFWIMHLNGVCPLQRSVSAKYADLRPPELGIQPTGFLSS